MKQNSPTRLKLIRILCLIGPSFLAFLYFSVLAQSVYQTEAHFFTGSAPAHSEADLAAAVEAGLFSPAFIEQADRDLNLREHFSQASQDPRFRLSSDTAPDHLYRYFEKMVEFERSPSSAMLKLKVRAFSPEFTQSLADYLLSAAGDLVTRVSGETQEPASLLVVTRPHAPQVPLIPSPVRGTVTVFVLSGLLYGIGRMLLATIRDHSV